MAQRMHSPEDEVVATEAVDPATLIAENQSLRDRLLRALAEVENTQRRSERLTQEARQYAIADLAREMLVVKDNLHRAIEAAQRHPPTSPVDAAFLDGVRATERMMMASLEGFGVRRIEVGEGARFDPAIHEAAMEVDDPDRRPGTVAQVIEDGYMIHDRLLRPVRVAVVKRRAEASADPVDVHRP